MPTITFFNLNENKKERVIQAIKKEFDRVPLIDMSVKNIVEDAKIARGSFYQYFTSREDAIDYIIDEEFKKEKEKLLKILDEKQGNIFSACYEYIDKNIDDTSFRPKYYIHMIEYLKEAKTFPIKSLDLDNVLKQTDLSKTNFNTIEQVKAAINMLLVITNVTKLTILNGCTSKEEGMREYRMQLEILENGILKK